MLVDLADFESPADLADQNYAEAPDQLASAEVIVVRLNSRPPDGDVETWAKGHLSPLHAERAPRASVHLLYLRDLVVGLTGNLGSAPGLLADEDQRTLFIDWLRAEELREFVRRSSAMFPSKGNIHYRSPSKQYCNVFLRVGNVQMGRHQIDVISFWLLPYMRGAAALLTDTWSISSIALNTLRLLSLHEPSRGPSDFDMLTCYQDGTLDVSSDTRLVLRHLSRRGQRRVLFVVSTVMSGASLRRLRADIASAGLDQSSFDFVSIYKLDKGCDISCLCDLSEGLDGETFESHLEPRPGSTIVEIDPHTYFPLHVVEQFVGLDKADQEKKIGINSAKDFVDSYRGSSSISVHRNATDANGIKLRHHAVYLDVAKMLDVERFRERFSRCLDVHKAVPTAIVIPPHEAASHMADFAMGHFEKHFGSKPPLIVHGQLSALEESWSRAPFEAAGVDDFILILDDVSTTGGTLMAYQKNLREIYQGRIHYLVGVARPPTQKEWAIRGRNLRYRAGQQDRQHVLSAIETFHLPDWQEQDCPWCKEAIALEHLAETLDLPEDLACTISERRRVLADSKASNGLTENALWYPSNGAAPSMTQNSIFLDHERTTPADVLASVLSSIQHLRVVPSGLHFGYPHLAILEPTDYIGATFTDVVLRLALMRGAHRRELQCWRDESEERRRSLVNELAQRDSSKERDQEALLFQMVVEIALQKLPAPKLSDEQWEVLGRSQPGRLLQLLCGK